ncbi:MAG TPA: hypothetical protein IGS53_22695 [Leptolyngbyaceae cyanobacterium M33_DOE_097]|uniref:DUF2808 domain-containing protein n=1 Tax=Oscillatoriales cyanobacterium SpSt-418 TaxID=2282169 RepID=A0A7C3PIY0_9CYAN|nr:hypothetical protein [Leptolyngbyaceae cyanobacterium M33_DOE_097]
MSPAIPVSGPQASTHQGGSELYSKNIIGPAWFTMSDFRVEGSAGDPLPPEQVGPNQSKYIVASNESVTASVKLTFNKSPLTALLMCLGIKLKVNFHFEGFGNIATEIDLTTEKTSEKDVYEYDLKLDLVPGIAGLTAGLYEVAATAEIGPGKNECAQHVFGYGYIQEFLLQVYAA